MQYSCITRFTKSDKKNHFQFSIFNFQFCISLILLLCLFVEVNAQTQLTNLPTFYITTENKQPIWNKEVYLPATLTIKSGDAFDEANIVTQIKGRGNSTWWMPKKPYRLKLDVKKNLLGLPAKEKSWVLLANYADKTLIRNALAFEISKIVGLEFTPSYKFIDLIFNDEFVGNYMLTDQVEVAGFRVPVQKQDASDVEEPAITGGYLLELDGFADSEPVWFTTPKALKITVKYPKDDEINEQQLSYITDYINQFENVLFSSSFDDPETGYRSWVDTTSLVNWYIACELTGNSDSFWSTYVYKKRNDPKIYFGPMWDYDIAFNNDDRLGDATKKLMREHAHHPRTWIERFWQDEWFQDAVERRWKALESDDLTTKLTNCITETAQLLQTSQQRNFSKWNNLNLQVYRETFLFRTYNEGVDYLKTYVKERVDFLSESFVKPEPPKPSEPFVAEDYYYMIMNKRTNNVIDLQNESVVHNSLLTMWAPKTDDDGQRWKIINLGNNLFRIVNKHSGLAMAGNNARVQLKQVTIKDTDNTQKWSIVPVNTGNIYGIVNKASTFVIDNSGGSFNNGNPVIEYDNQIATNENQQWYLQKMESTYTDIPALEKTSGITYYQKDQVLYLQSVPQNAGIRLYNMQGGLMKELIHVNGEVSLTHLQPGIYILQTAWEGGIENIKLRITN